MHRQPSSTPAPEPQSATGPRVRRHRLTRAVAVRLRVRDARHWMRSAVRRTIIPFVTTTLVVTGAGWAMPHHAPGARSLGEVIARR